MHLHFPNNYNHLDEIITDLQKSSNFYFRGQKDAAFKLQTPMAYKYKEPQIVTANAKKIIETFKKGICANNLQNEIYLETESSKTFPHIIDWYWLFQAQHLGIPTPLMDWSFNWYAAMYFCCCDALDINGQLWLFDYARLGDKINRNPENKYGNEEPIFSKSFWENTFTGFINPSHYVNTSNQAGAENRKGQQGLFFMQPSNNNCKPLEEREEYYDYIHLIEIPSQVKKEYMQIAKAKVPMSNYYEGFRGVTKEANQYYSTYANTVYTPKSERLEKVVNATRVIFNFPD